MIMVMRAGLVGLFVGLFALSLVQFSKTERSAWYWLALGTAIMAGVNIALAVQP